MHYPRIMQPTHARIVQVPNDNSSTSQPSSTSTVFPPLKPAIARNFLITDTYLESPAAGVAPAAYDVPLRTSAPDREASAAADFLAPFQGLKAVSDDVLELLPEQCRAAFERARGKEEEWFGRWGDEKEVMARREPVVDKAIVPYSMLIQ